jgi:Flp pilus assembly protein TadD
MAPAHNNLGSALRLQGKFSDAIASLEKAIELDPKLPIAHNNRGVALQGLKKFGDARAAFERAMAIAPEDPEAYNNLGNLSSVEEKFEEALQWFAKAQKLHPDCAEVHNNLANVLREQGRLDKAAEHYRRAIDLKPCFPDAWSNLGNALREQGLFPEALAAYATAIEQKPDNPGFRWNKSLAELSCGKLERGWEAYEWGFACKQRQPVRPFTHPRWEGQSLNGKTILTWGEQGVGDEILFANCLPDLAAAADDCIVECDPRLVPLFARSFPDCEVIRRTDPPQPRTRWPDIDLHSPMGTLPRYFRPSIDRFPRQGGYLRADPARVEYWKKRLAQLGPGPKVGISWRSRLMTAARAKHYIALERWDPILTTPGVCFVNLQYCDYDGDIVEVRRRLGVAIHHFEDLNLRDALDDVAALISALDLNITIANINLALGGAVNTETWLFAIRHSMTWAGLGTGATPWFPKVQVFSRDWNEDSAGSVQAVAAALRRRCAL